ncbi:hypothetical protein ABVT39_006332 [Epinephelus coioides]
MSSKRHRESGASKRKKKAKQEEARASLEDKLNNKVDSLEKSLDKMMTENQKLLMLEMERCWKEMKEGLDLDIGHLQARMEALEQKIRGGKHPPRFDSAVSLIVYGLHQEINENILEKINLMFFEGLGNDILAKEAERMKKRGDASAAVRVECKSAEEKVAILRLKQKLREQSPYERVYVKSAKSHTEHLIEINFKTILKELPQGKDYFVMGNGRLVKRDDDASAGKRRGGERRSPSQRGGY